jgi:hypothetical protein
MKPYYILFVILSVTQTACIMLRLYGALFCYQMMLEVWNLEHGQWAPFHGVGPADRPKQHPFPVDLVDLIPNIFISYELYVGLSRIRLES